MEDLLPVIDLAPLVRLLEKEQQEQPITAAALDADQAVAAVCRDVASSLTTTSCLLVRDPRVDAAASDAFLVALGAYFARNEALKLRDCRPHLHYQVGATPPGVETPRCVADPSICEEALKSHAPEHRATLPRGADKKWRFFWRIGERPISTDFPELNAADVVPEGLEASWPLTMNAWGGALLRTTEAVAVAAARGLRMEDPAALRDLMRGGPHLLAPTGSDLSPSGGLTPGDVLAGFHYDLNLLTIHGKATYPGLRVWLRDGRRLDVRVPEGCLLVQAGKQLEHVTGGRVLAGWHEVIATEQALEMAKERLGGGEASCGPAGWRVSSTLFSHARSDSTLRPLLEEEEGKGYAPIKAGAQVQAELEAIKLAAAPAAQV
jgi:hypothetical protein